MAALVAGVATAAVVLAACGGDGCDLLVVVVIVVLVVVVLVLAVAGAAGASSSGDGSAVGVVVAFNVAVVVLVAVVVVVDGVDCCWSRFFLFCYNWFFLCRRRDHRRHRHRCCY